MSRFEHLVPYQGEYQQANRPTSALHLECLFVVFLKVAPLVEDRLRTPKSIGDFLEAREQKLCLTRPVSKKGTNPRRMPMAYFTVWALEDS
jgi:hypothetical protein